MVVTNADASLAAARVHPAGLDPPDGGAPSDPGACQSRLQPVSLAQPGGWVLKNA